MTPGRDKHEPSFAYMFDAFTLWRISPEFPTNADFTPARGKVSKPPEGYYNHPDCFQPTNYAVVVSETKLVDSNPADYDNLPGQWPKLVSNYAGDVFYDDNGDIHFLYSRSDISTNFATQQYHMLIRDGKIIFDQKIFDRSGYLIMCKDSSGDYYILTSGPLSGAILYKAVSCEDSGWSFQKVGEFVLPIPVEYAGFSQAYINGISGHGNEISIIYPVKSANTPTGYADEFAYFRLNLNTTEHTHVWDTDFTVDQTPTCTEGGRKSIHCQICNETKDEIAIPATGHSFVYHERIDATKEAQGTKAHYTCKNCAMVFDAMKNETTADSLIIPKLTEENTDQPGDGAGSTTNGTAGIPQTGDKSSMIVWSALLLVSLVGLVTLTVVKKRRENNLHYLLWHLSF